MTALMMVAAMTVVAVLVPDVPLEEQPNLPAPPSTVRALLVELRAQQQPDDDPARGTGPTDPYETLEGPPTTAGDGRNRPADPDTPDPTAPDASGDSDDPEAGIPQVWLDLADCETGDRRDGRPVPGTRRWHVGADADHLEDERPPWSSGIYYGGLQFDRWESWPWAVDVGGHDVPANPANATPRQQVAVAETLLEIHPAGWRAWPDCARRLGLN